MTQQTHNSYWKRSFLTIALGQAFSLIGSSAAQFALIWWLASETGSALIMAFSGLMAFLPQLILGPFAGVWIDRLKRKYVAIGAYLFIGFNLCWLSLLGRTALLECLPSPGSARHRRRFSHPCYSSNCAASSSSRRARPGQRLEPIHAVRRLYAGTSPRGCALCRPASVGHYGL